MSKVDLIIIGAGPGGYRAAEYAAKQGLKVVIFEGSEVGGTCLNVGCIPTKTYVHSATFAEARERMATVVSQLRQGVEGILSHPNITLVREKGVFTDAHTVGDYTADNIIIATGSETKWLPIKGKDNPRVVDSTGLLNLETQPKRLAIIGAGVIGMEFASVFNRFGTEVTVIEYLKECLPALDSDIAKRLRKYLERPRVGDGTSGMKGGITFKMKTAVEDIADIDADVVLMATGRKPRVQADFANAGIEFDERKGVTVDDHFKTTVNGIFAIGDVNGKQMLAHAAEMQAIHVVNQIIGKPDNIRFDIMPAAIFTQPEAACVGPTEDQLKAEGIAYECRKSFWRANGKAMAMNETEGMLKLFVSPDDGAILGCHAYGAHSADIVQEVSVLMCKHTTIAELADMVHIHPTLSEILKSAVE
ncbi:dihydrolipoamide dehydrogenase [Prevotella sp. khp1]|uniref:dihydrolipoyl dehydrogenase family protein n=1 Tax=Prevotellaceae TaxID=171552 RepID=UPI000891E18A|nr:MULTISPECIES: NAD(P)/FAD-dependent oxidoreductase [Prevotellaceae]QVJ80165.1 NAD(P)/FAD-dependent oxidoreductase [Xylanibacter ruminicola]SDQ68746.1 dihydrolipoamide dehydrogenase [Prevotella sp. khp1]